MKRFRATTAYALRVGAIFRRKPGTFWSEKEVKRFKTLLPFNAQDFAIVERYYARQWPPCSDRNMLRHDLYTFLNNYPGEVDRARVWCEAHPIAPPPKKVVKVDFTPPEEKMTEAERSDWEANFIKLMGRPPRLEGEL